MSTADNKRMARNTIFLYLRSFVSMVISLYTSRKILEILGVDDFGILNVVGGVIAMFTFLSGSMSVATQRFLTFELGRGEGGNYKHVFSMTCIIHGLIVVGEYSAEYTGRPDGGSQCNLSDVDCFGCGRYTSNTI